VHVQEQKFYDPHFKIVHRIGHWKTDMHVRATAMMQYIRTKQAG